MSVPNRSTAVDYDANNKINDQNLPPANQPLNWDNTKLAPGVSDIAGVVNVAPRIWARITLATTTGGLVLINWWAMWANATFQAPTLSRSTTGVFTLTTPPTVNDEYDASFGNNANIPVALLAAMGSLEGSTPGFVNASASGNVITINTFDHTGSASDLNGVTLFIIGY